jgi:hypothetical protein
MPGANSPDEAVITIWVRFSAMGRVNPHSIMSRFVPSCYYDVRFQ